jgi:hypothetical protein
VKQIQAIRAPAIPNGIRRSIVTGVGVCLPFTVQPGVLIQKDVQQFMGIWDTGATGSVITQKIVSDVGLKPIGQTQVETANGIFTSNTYLVNLTLPMGLMIPNLTVTEGTLPSGSDALIGMDVITLGDFVITNLHGHTSMNYRVPSMIQYDWVADGERYNAFQQKKAQPRAAQRTQPVKRRKR